LFSTTYGTFQISVALLISLVRRQGREADRSHPSNKGVNNRGAIFTPSLTTQRQLDLHLRLKKLDFGIITLQTSLKKRLAYLRAYAGLTQASSMNTPYFALDAQFKLEMTQKLVWLYVKCLL
jgi:hypothetical protein